MVALKWRVLVGLCIIQFAASMLPVFAQALPPLQSRIRKSDPKKYQGILDAKDWKNPQLIVRPTGIEVIGITPAGSGIPVDSVFDVLGHLPDSAWPYGLVVAVEDVGLRASKNDDAPIHANRVKLLRILKQNGIAVELWPSA
jgi:hypothetical protein